MRMDELKYLWQDKDEQALLMRLFRGLPKGYYEPHIMVDYIYLENIDTGETYKFNR